MSKLVAGRTYRHKVHLFGWRFKYERRTRDSFMGRFGGGWQWELGFQASSSTLIINCLVFSIRVNKLEYR